MTACLNFIDVTIITCDNFIYEWNEFVALQKSRKKTIIKEDICDVFRDHGIYNSDYCFYNYLFLLMFLFLILIFFFFCFVYWFIYLMFLFI